MFKENRVICRPFNYRVEEWSNMKYQSRLLRIGRIAGMYYSADLKADSVVVYGVGAPITPDNGSLPDASVILKYGVDLFVPDYIGYGRSDGVFTPEGCIKTFLNLYDTFKKGCVGKNYYGRSEKKFKYKRVIFIGRSFGGAYVPLLPRYNSEIKELGIFCPAVNQKAQGSVIGEETNKEFMQSMKKDGYHYLYRGILDKVWWKHLENEDGLSPMDSIECLSEVKLFIGHGKKDKCIHYLKSVEYYAEILKMFPDKKEQFKLKLYANGDHGLSTTNQAAADFMEWLGFKKVVKK